jgi:PAS domain S-box-containing protein
MQKKPKVSDDLAELRHRAELRLSRNRPATTSAQTHDDNLRRLQELEVHQIELEMQNAELKTTRNELEVALESYTDLYDFAPVGYFTFAADGTIQMVNLTGACLVGIERSRLVGRSFGLLLSAKLRPVFNSFLKEVLSGKTKQSRDFELLSQGQPPRTVSIEAQCLVNGQECRAAVMDVTERKRAELALNRMEVLAASNRKLEQEIVERQAVEESLKESEQHQIQLLEQSRQMQEELRHLSRQVLLAQEEERKRISRELHDVVAQTLTGINLHLTALKIEASANPKRLAKKIATTQRLIEKSVDIVHRFARQLRPTVLDDLGIIPALHSYLKEFKTQTGIQIQFTAFAGVEHLDGAKRTVLFRIAQAALSNVAQHAQATRVKLTIKKVSQAVCMEINDDGRSFDVERVLCAKTNKRLGLIGMRERVEMVGGSFCIESAPGKGTTILAHVPLDISPMNQVP